MIRSIKPFVFFRSFYLGLIFSYAVIPAVSQTVTTIDKLAALPRAEMEMTLLIKSLQEVNEVELKNALNRELIQKFEEALEIKGAIDYPFSLLESISDLKSPSSNFRIFTWELEDSVGINRYYGFVIFRSGNDVIVEKLIDAGFQKETSEYTTFTSERWLGALYYDLREIKYKKDTYYLLLGINRNEQLVKKKVVEPVWLDEKSHFGKEVFNYSGNHKFKRKIYRYSHEADLTLIFEKDQALIVMDHLMPLKSQYEGKFEYYVPDLSFDALEYRKGRWKYVPDYDARLDKNLKDRYFEMELPKEEKVY